MASKAPSLAGVPKRKATSLSSRRGTAVVLVSMIAAAASSTPRPADVYYVAPNAGPSGDGTLDNPFTLAAARRALSGNAAGSTVVLRGGDYDLLSSPLMVSAGDESASQ